MRKPLRGEAPCEGSTIPEAGLQWSFASVGAWLSLVEHSVRDRGVGGSNPLAPTTFLRKASEFTLPGHSVPRFGSRVGTEWSARQIPPSAFWHPNRSRFAAHRDSI